MCLAESRMPSKIDRSSFTAIHTNFVHQTSVSRVIRLHLGGMRSGVVRLLGTLNLSERAVRPVDRQLHILFRAWVLYCEICAWKQAQSERYSWSAVNTTSFRWASECFCGSDNYSTTCSTGTVAARDGCILSTRTRQMARNVLRFICRSNKIIAF
jgi:hypothetical protein